MCKRRKKKKNPTVASHATPFFLISAVIILVISKKASHFHTQIYGLNEIVWVTMLFWYAMNEVLNPLNATKKKWKKIKWPTPNAQPEVEKKVN